MNLYITRDYSKPFSADDFCIKAALLNDNGTHLFIASNKWDTIYVDLCEELPVGKLEFLPMVCSNIKVHKCSFMSKFIDQLIELFPDKSGSLRKCKLSNADPFSVVMEYTYE